MLQAVAPDQTPLGPIMRLADIHLVAVTVERDGKPVVIADALRDDPDAASIFIFAAPPPLSLLASAPVCSAAGM
jgi:hypothetical protein